MSRRTYANTRCWLCNKLMSANGGGLYNHYMVHVRRGEMTHTQWRTPEGYLYNDFKQTPKPAVSNQPDPSNPSERTDI